MIRQSRLFKSTSRDLITIIIVCSALILISLLLNIRALFFVNNLAIEIFTYCFIYTLGAFIYLILLVRKALTALMLAEGETGQFRNSQDFIQNMIDSIPDMIINIDNNMNILRANKEVTNLFHDIVGKQFGDLQTEAQLPLKKNNMIVTEEALRESEEKYLNFIQHFQGIVYRWDLNNKPVFFNGSVSDITGYTETEFIKQEISWHNLIINEDQDILKNNAIKIGKIPGFQINLEYRIISKDKKTKWVNHYLQNIANSSGKVVYIQGTIYDITKQKEAEVELNKSREELRNLALYLESIREEEKKHIAVEIHDEVGHALTALKLELAWLLKKKFIKQDILYERIKKMNDLIESTIRKVRSISSQLRPSVLDHFGLVAALEWQAVEFQKRSAVRCKLNILNSDIRLDEKRTTAIFRIFQEILTNVARHAQATRVDVTFDRVGNDLRLRVSDNGKGIKQEQMNNRKSFGLMGMNERALAMGGKLTISGVIGMGTTVTLDVPISN